jgi:hypothetical protein
MASTVQDAYDKDFWLGLEMRGPATLAKLDDYLLSSSRNILIA